MHINTHTSLGKTTTTDNKEPQAATAELKEAEEPTKRKLKRKEEKTKKRDTNSQIIPSTALYHRQNGRLQHLHRGLCALAVSLRGNRTHRGFVTHSHHRASKAVLHIHRSCKQGVFIPPHVK